MIEIAEKCIARLTAEPIKTNRYYCITLLTTEDGVTEVGSQTHWTGYTETKPRREIREASIMNAEKFVTHWRETGQTAFVVDTIDELGLFFLHGGNSIIEKAVAETVIPSWLEPHTTLNVGEYGFASPELLPKTALSKAPTPKLRMQIIKRDHYRCRVCGRDPSNHTDVELHVHHIRPWSSGGCTEQSNLMTLCHTCHNGLNPHFESSLFKLFPKESKSTQEHNYWKSMYRYQDQAALRFDKEE